MTENILIEFNADTSGIDTAEQALGQIGKVDNELTNIFSKTNAAIKEREKIINTLSGNIGKVVNDFKNAEKAAIGLYGSKGIKEYQQQILKSSESVKLLTVSIGAAAEKLKTMQEGSAEFNQLNSEMNEAVNIIKNLSQSTEETDVRTQSFKSQLRALKNELQQMEAAGEDDTAMFRQMSIEAARLEDQIGDTNQQIRILSSDTFKFDALLSGVQGVTAAFGLAQSASALLGTESEDLQKTLVKINAVMQISASLQQLDNLLKGESAAKEAVKIALQKISLLNTKLQNAADSESIIVRNAAAAAQWVLNAAMAANPAGLLLVAIGAIAGALMIFSSNTETAAEKQEKLNAEWEKGRDYLKAYEEQVNKPLKDRIEKAKSELAIMQSQNIAQDKIIEKKKELADLERDMAGRRAGFQGMEIDDLQKTSDEIVKKKDLLRKLEQEKNQVDGNWFYERWFGGERSKSDVEDAIKATELELKRLETTYQDADARRKDQIDANTNSTIASNEKIKHDTEQHYKDIVGFSQAAVNAQIEGTRARLYAEIELAKATQEQKKQDPNLTKGELLAIETETAAKIRKLHNDITKMDLQDAKDVADAKVLAAENGSIEELELKREALKKQTALELAELGLSTEKQNLIKTKAKEEDENLQNEILSKRISNQKAQNDAALALAKEGTEAEFNLKLNALKIEKSAALLAAKSNVDERLKVENEYWKKVEDLTKSYNFKIAEDTYNIRISTLQSKIAPLEISQNAATNGELLKLKTQLFKEQAEKEKLSVQNSVASEEYKAVQIIAIDAKLKADQDKLKKDTEKAQSDSLLNARILGYEQHKLELEKKLLTASGKEKLDLQKDINELLAMEDKTRLDKLYDDYKKDLISWQDYQNAKLEIEKANLEKGKQVYQDYVAAKQHFEETAWNAFGQLSNQLFDDRKARMEEDAQQDKDLLDKKQISQNEFDKREKARKKEMARIDKEKAIFDIAIDLIKNIIKVKSQAAILLANPATAAYAPVALGQIPYLIAEAAIATALVSAKKYRTGGLIDGPGTGTSDSIPIWASKGEFVATAAATSKYKPALEAINNLKFEEYLASLPMFNDIPTITPLPVWAENQVKQNTNIDYELLAKEVAKHVGKISDIAGVDVNITEDGISVIAKKGMTKTKFLNKKYSFK
jgi:hypothetical protein